MSNNQKKNWVSPKVKSLKITKDTKTGTWSGKKENSPKQS